MDFALSATQTAVRTPSSASARGSTSDYWLARDTDGGFPHDLHRAFAADGWLGICIPEAYGGSGLGLAEAAVMMQAIAAVGRRHGGRVGACT